MEISPCKDSVCTDFSNLEVDFLGIHCENPFFLASSVIASNYDMISKAFEMGWAGAAYKTISKQRICEVSPRYDQIGKGSTSFVGFRNMEQLSENSPEEDFDIIRRLKKNYPKKVIIASIMGNSLEQWQELAIMAQNAGADIIECNFSCPHMEAHGMGSDIGQRPDIVALYTKAVKQVVKIPVMTKMTPNITHIEEPAIASVRNGADAIAAINTIKSITMHERSEVSNQTTISGYSGRAVKPIAERMILDMKQQKELREVPMSGIGGIENWHDAYEFLSIGCSTVQICTAVMQYGYRIIDDLRLGLSNFLKERGLRSVEDIIGENIEKFVHPDSLDRTTYVLPKFDHAKC
ncbi:MAG: NAD-dependent dihydropyrimidine dehydrogenase subunit PreA, partial [Alistipes sp.]|nr:NAD-dependent dihydropyrimidine dehydrogenase subunit PreA [Candidatus Alistipes equi]